VLELERLGYAHLNTWRRTGILTYIRREANVPFQNLGRFCLDLATGHFPKNPCHWGRACQIWQGRFLLAGMLRLRPPLSFAAQAVAAAYTAPRQSCLCCSKVILTAADDDRVAEDERCRRWWVCKVDLAVGDTANSKGPDGKDFEMVEIKRAYQPVIVSSAFINLKRVAVEMQWWIVLWFYLPVVLFLNLYCIWFLY